MGRRRELAAQLRRRRSFASDRGAPRAHRRTARTDTTQARGGARPAREKRDSRWVVGGAPAGGRRRRRASARRRDPHRHRITAGERASPRVPAVAPVPRALDTRPVLRARGAPSRGGHHRRARAKARLRRGARGRAGASPGRRRRGGSHPRGRRGATRVARDPEGRDRRAEARGRVQPDARLSRPRRLRPELPRRRRDTAGALSEVHAPVLASQGVAHGLRRHVQARLLLQHVRRRLGSRRGRRPSNQRQARSVHAKGGVPQGPLRRVGGEAPRSGVRRREGRGDGAARGRRHSCARRRRLFRSKPG